MRKTSKSMPFIPLRVDCLTAFPFYQKKKKASILEYIFILPDMQKQKAYGHLHFLIKQSSKLCQKPLPFFGKHIKLKISIT